MGLLSVRKKLQVKIRRAEELPRTLVPQNAPASRGLRRSFTFASLNQQASSALHFILQKKAASLEGRPLKFGKEHMRAYFNARYGNLFQCPADVLASTPSYRKDMHFVSQWIDERYEQNHTAIAPTSQASFRLRRYSRAANDPGFASKAI